MVRKAKHVYGEVNNRTSLKHIFNEIRRDVADARSRSDLTELYRRAGYLITLTYAPSWDKKFGDAAAEFRDVAAEEFARTARKINSRAKAIGTHADYDDEWGRSKRKRAA